MAMAVGGLGRRKIEPRLPLCQGQQTFAQNVITEVGIWSVDNCLPEDEDDFNERKKLTIFLTIMNNDATNTLYVGNNLNEDLDNLTSDNGWPIAPGEAYEFEYCEGNPKLYAIAIGGDIEGRFKREGY